MFRVTDITAARGGKQLFCDASLTLEPGQVKGLVAPNGRGKTTLLRLIAGAHLRGCSGTVQVDGVPPHDERAFRQTVFYAPGEGTLLYPDASARFHLESARRLWDSPYDVDDVARRCGIDAWLRRPVHTLSQGMKQQLTLAIAYMTHATYLLLDEPMNALDPTNVQLNSRLVHKAAAHGCGVIMSSHILDNVDRVCDCVLFVRDGQLVEVPSGGAGSLALYNELYGDGAASDMWCDEEARCERDGSRMATQRLVGAGDRHAKPADAHAGNARPRGKHFRSS